MKRDMSEPPQSFSWNCKLSNIEKAQTNKPPRLGLPVSTVSVQQSTHIRIFHLCIARGIHFQIRVQFKDIGLPITDRVAEPTTIFQAQM
jgi:hypothetical protein